MLLESNKLQMFIQVVKEYKFNVSGKRGNS